VPVAGEASLFTFRNAPVELAFGSSERKEVSDDEGANDLSKKKGEKTTKLKTLWMNRRVCSCQDRKRANPLTQKTSAYAGDAYPFAVTTKGIRPHLDKVPMAFCACITELYLSSS
jgi:hypothetical protein